MRDAKGRERDREREKKEREEERGLNEKQIYERCVDPAVAMSIHLGWCFLTGVSKLRSAGCMRPSRAYKAARDDFAKVK